MDLQSNSYKKNLYKADIYKADSQKKDTFFVHQMKNLPIPTLRKVGTRLKKHLF